MITELNRRRLEYLILALFTTAGITNIFNFYYLFQRLEIFEFLFLATVIFTLLTTKKGFLKAAIKTISPLDKAVVFSLLIFSLNVLLHISRSGVFDLLTILYLGSVYFFFSRLPLLGISYYSLISKIKISLWIKIVIAFVGYIAIAVFNIPNRTYDFYQNYPYFGDVIRSNGMVFTPNIQLSLLAMYFILIMPHIEWNKWSHILLSIFTTGAMMITFAKEQVEVYLLLTIYFLLYRFRSNKRLSSWIHYFILFSWIFVSLATLFVVCSDHCFDKTWSLGPAMAELWPGSYLRPTGYYFLLKAELHAWSISVFTGVGFGNFGHLLRDIRAGGYYPDYMPILESHNLLFGLIAELGYTCIYSIIFSEDIV